MQKLISEKSVVQALAQFLKRKGYYCQTEAKLDFGFADLIAIGKHQIKVFEVKNQPDVHEISQALGQVLMYKAQVAARGRLLKDYRKVVPVVYAHRPRITQEQKRFLKKEFEAYGVRLQMNEVDATSEDRESERKKRQVDRVAGLLTGLLYLLIIFLYEG